jgi:hypothetical protein
MLPVGVTRRLFVVIDTAIALAIHAGFSRPGFGIIGSAVSMLAVAGSAHLGAVQVVEQRRDVRS